MNKIILRFDMDEMKEPQMERFLSLLKVKKFKAHLFALEYQIRNRKLNILLKEMEQLGCEIGLHSEPFFPRWELWKMPNFFISYALRYVKFLQLNNSKNKDKIKDLIAVELKKQAETFKKAGFDVKSHSLHAQNNKLNFTISETWELLKWASIQSKSFNNFYSHEKIMSVPKGSKKKQEFKPPFFNSTTEIRMNILSTSFDDIFFHTMNGNLQDARDNIEKALSWCENNGVDTFVVNIHPYHDYTHKLYNMSDFIDLLMNVEGWELK